MKRPAVFFDRDNTLIINSGYLGDPAQVKLMPGAADAVARIRQLGYAIVIFSNQSGVARGLFDEDAVHEVNARMESLLVAENPAAVIDRHEFCPFHPEGEVEHYRQDSPLRKPKPGMIYNAAEALALDLEQSWIIGDAPRDIEAGHAAACRTILFHPQDVPVSDAAKDVEKLGPEYVVTTLREAVDYIEKNRQRGQSQTTAPQPPLKIAPAMAAPTPVLSSRAIERPTPAIATTTATLKPSPPAAVASDAPPPAREPSPEKPTAAAPIAARDTRDTRENRIVVPLVNRSGRSSLNASSNPAASQPAAESSSAPASSPPAGNASDASVSNPTNAAPDSPPSTRRLELLADQVLSELRRQNEQDATDFSVSKLLAGIVQMIALAILFVAYVRRDTGSLQTVLLLAIFAQTLTIALLIMSRQK